MRHPLPLLAALAALAPLAGCLSFGAKPPPVLLNLTATAQPPVGQLQTAAGAPAQAATLSVGRQQVATVTTAPVPAESASITIQTPGVPQELATVRVPVVQGPTAVAYVKNAAWIEPPARLFERLVADTVTVRTGRVVLPTSQSFAAGGAVLAGELRGFGVDAGTREAVVTFDATLIRAGGGVVEKQRFEARAPVAAVDGPSAGTALNTAANQVAAQVADWVGR